FYSSVRFNFTIYHIQNPPKRVESSLRSHIDADEVTTKNGSYFQPSTEKIVELYKLLQTNDTVIGQNGAKKASCVSLFKAAYSKQKKPTVLMFYGPSGVGKTELAKSISDFYEGNLTRIQFSMMQTDEAYKYVFGDTHATPSMAKDLLARETNIVLIDEFDKCAQGLYNVFYQIFDEGIFEDANYKVDVTDCIFILTSNFNDEESIAKTVGMPVYSRIDKKVKFEKLSIAEIELVINKIFNSTTSVLNKTDVKLIEESTLKEEYISNLSSFNNIRMLDKFIENDVYTLLFSKRLAESE
ncbi:AAA family ATPase, partial [Leuconostoc mesenteroides]|uniref:AAA family ATPase n=2 Tax=Leuconostoc mesenteroides TaxID=1245 RepID=UPI00235DD0F1